MQQIALAQLLTNRDKSVPISTLDTTIRVRDNRREYWTRKQLQTKHETKH